MNIPPWLLLLATYGGLCLLVTLVIMGLLAIHWQEMNNVLRSLDDTEKRDGNP